MENLKISEANKDDIAVWKNLQKYPAWKRLVAHLQAKVKEADAVINLIGGDREVEYTKRDMAIIKKNAYLDLIELPEKMIEDLAGTGNLPTEQMDAFRNEDDEEDHTGLQSTEDDDY